MARATGAKPSAPPDYTNVHTMRDRHHLRLAFPSARPGRPRHRRHPPRGLRFDRTNPGLAPVRPTDTYVEFDLGTPHGGMGGENQDRERAYETFRIQRLLFRVAAGLVAPYARPWMFPQALEIASAIIRPVSEGGKIDPTL